MAVSAWLDDWLSVLHAQSNFELRTHGHHVVGNLSLAGPQCCAAVCSAFGYRAPLWCASLSHFKWARPTSFCCMQRSIREGLSQARRCLPQTHFGATWHHSIRSLLACAVARDCAQALSLHDASCPTVAALRCRCTAKQMYKSHADAGAASRQITLVTLRPHPAAPNRRALTPPPAPLLLPRRASGRTFPSSSPRRHPLLAAQHPMSQTAATAAATTMVKQRRITMRCQGGSILQQRAVPWHCRRRGA